VDGGGEVTGLCAQLLWNSMCWHTLGVDCEGEVAQQLTSLGGAAIARDVPTYISGTRQRGEVAAFLRQWADDLEADK